MARSNFSVLMVVGTLVQAQYHRSWRFPFSDFESTTGPTTMSTAVAPSVSNRRQLSTPATSNSTTTPSTAMASRKGKPWPAASSSTLLCKDWRDPRRRPSVVRRSQWYWEMVWQYIASLLSRIGKAWCSSLKSSTRCSNHSSTRSKRPRKPVISSLCDQVSLLSRSSWCNSSSRNTVPTWPSRGISWSLSQLASRSVMPSLATCFGSGPVSLGT